MVKVFVVYDTRYGNTKAVAEKIVKGMNEVEGIETTIVDLKELNPEQMGHVDAILIGSPNHYGSSTRAVRHLIDNLGKLDLKTERVAVFDTCFDGDFNKAVKKMEKRINKKAPELKIIAPGLSIRVKGMKGPIGDGEIARCIDFGRMIANKLQRR